MKAEKNLENLKKELKKLHQSHLLAFWGQLTTEQRQNLLVQIRGLGLPTIENWVANLVLKYQHPKISSGIYPVAYYGHEPADVEQRQKYKKAIDVGKELIRRGKVAVLVVAGGQGTRLGFNGPKGDFPISPVKSKTLFRIFAETIAAVSKRYGAVCPWYIMTSPLNHTETVGIFRANNHYGLDKDDVFIFQQGTLPNFGLDGKILMADKDRLACSPDGHGGCIKALNRSGALADMKKRGIEYISYWQVDNPLVNIFDALFIGLHALDEAEMSSKGIIKTSPYEKVGNFCLLDGKVTVIEYSDLPNELTEKRNPDGSLAFQLGSIGIHLITRTFVEKLNTKDFSLPLHRAVKKIPHIDGQGNPVEPDQPNGIKLESFIFDAIPLASKSIILQTVRSQEFAPTKNATGADSVEVTRQMMVARSADWLESAGVSVPRKPDGSADCLIEIAPSFAMEKDDVKEKLNQIPKIKPKDTIYLE